MATQNKIAENPNYLDSYALWDVTTEGDCEGRTIKHLGQHEGHLDEIAFKLGSQAMYTLKFSLATKPEPEKELLLVPQVEVQLNIDSGTWNMSDEERIAFFKRMLQGRDVTVSKSTCFASVKLQNTIDPEELLRRKYETLKTLVLDKLSPEELDVLRTLGLD